MEVICNGLTAFGIDISSRHNKAKEIIELLQFSLEASKLNLHEYVLSIFYDSNACLCVFEFKPSLLLGSYEEQALHRIAIKTISQFDWFGSIEHGPGGEEFERQLQEFLTTADELN